MKLLIIDDDSNIRFLLQTNLEARSYSVDVAKDAEEGLQLVNSNKYDLVLLDNVLPGKRGLTLCSELRKTGKNMPIIVLSVQSQVPDKVALLNAGADDYIIKPFSFNELIARMNAVMRRPRPSENNNLVIGDLEIDYSGQAVRRAGKEVYLTKKEFLLLDYLARNNGRLLSRGMIMENVWDKKSLDDTNTIETHILNLRKKIDLFGSKKLIHTLSGRGYKLEIRE